MHIMMANFPIDRIGDRLPTHELTQISSVYLGIVVEVPSVFEVLPTSTAAELALGVLIHERRSETWNGIFGIVTRVLHDPEFPTHTDAGDFYVTVNVPVA